MIPIKESRKWVCFLWIDWTHVAAKRCVALWVMTRVELGISFLRYRFHHSLRFSPVPGMMFPSGVSLTRNWRDPPLPCKFLLELLMLSTFLSSFEQRWFHQFASPFRRKLHSPVNQLHIHILRHPENFLLSLLKRVLHFLFSAISVQSAGAGEIRCLFCMDLKKTWDEKKLRECVLNCSFPSVVIVVRFFIRLQGCFFFQNQFSIDLYLGLYDKAVTDQTRESFRGFDRFTSDTHSEAAHPLWIVQFLFSSQALGWRKIWNPLWKEMLRNTRMAVLKSFIVCWQKMKLFWGKTVMGL